MTLQEIQYKAQGIIHKWRDDDSAPYIEFVEELAHMIVPEPSEDLEEAAKKFAVFYDQGTCDSIAQDCFIAGAKWDRSQMMEEAVEGQVFGATDVKALYEGKVYVVSNLVQDIDYNLRPNDKVRIIIVKEDEK